jgi:hypothetical protein
VRFSKYYLWVGLEFVELLLFEKGELFIPVGGRFWDAMGHVWVELPELTLEVGVDLSNLSSTPKDIYCLRGLSLAHERPDSFTMRSVRAFWNSFPEFSQSSPRRSRRHCKCSCRPGGE